MGVHRVHNLEFQSWEDVVKCILLYQRVIEKGLIISDDAALERQWLL